MSGGGGDPPTASAYSLDPAYLAKFMQTGIGQKFADQYNPANSYAQVGTNFQSYDPKSLDSSKLGMYTGVGNDVTEFIRAYQAWANGNEQSQANWDSYSKAVSANMGGEGDNTITTGAAVSQRNQLLGALANAGKPPGDPNSSSTMPTPGLGTFGTDIAKQARGKS